MKKQIYVALMIVMVMAGAMFATRARNTQQVNTPLTSIPNVPVEETASVRGDTGRLTMAEYTEAQQKVVTRSSHYVLNDVKGNSVTLPITGQNAKVGIFSQDGGAEFQLLSPTGQVTELRPIQQDFNFGEGTAMRSIEGKFEATPLQAVTERGNYTLNIKGGKGKPVTVVVNDANELVFNTWLSENAVDLNNPSEKIEIRARIEGADNATLTTVTARLTNEDGDVTPAVKLQRDKDGSFFYTINPQNLGKFNASTFTKIVVDAEGSLQLEKDSQPFRRTGYLELITGASKAQLISVVDERLTKEDLEINVGIKVASEGRFHLRGELVNSKGEPVAWAQAAENFGKGTQGLTLKFDRTLVPAGDTYTLRNLELTDTTVMPGIRSARTIGDYRIVSRIR
ncbi:MAG: hypothetical protein K1Y36_29720 [Blastocatellia bacterium]|nr:hypothetical protein [Blastocatellia bacterium]